MTEQNELEQQMKNNLNVMDDDIHFNQEGEATVYLPKGQLEDAKEEFSLEVVETYEYEYLVKISGVEQ